ncbi:MAG: hypothetical protein WA001_02375, partial [Patescibacteria group bacterium]
VASSGSSSATTGSGGGACVPVITAKVHDSADGDVTPGTKGFRAVSMTLTASDCADVEVSRMDFQLGDLSNGDPTDPTPFCSAPCAAPSDWNFGNVKVMQHGVGNTVMGPEEFKTGTSSQPALASFFDPFTLPAGSTLELDIVLDVANPLKTDIVDQDFRLYFLGLGTTQPGTILEVDPQTGDPAFTVVGSKLKITLDPATPKSQIVVGGKDEWVPFSRYTVKNLTSEQQMVVTAGAALEAGSISSDVADFTDVALAMNGNVLFTQQATAGVMFLLDGAPFPIAANASVTLEVWGKMASVSSSATCPSGHGCARSGHTPAMRLEDLQLASDPAGIYQDGDPISPPAMVLRKSQPIVTKQALSSTTLANIDQDLITFQVAADAAGAIAFKEFHFGFAVSPGLTLTNFRLRRGATDIDSAAYATEIDQCDSMGSNCSDNGTSIIGGAFSQASLSVGFAPGQEETIAGSGNVYTLHATVSNVVPGNQVTVTVDADSSLADIATGYLAFDRPGVYLLLDARSNLIRDDSFTWSDLSEVPHSPGGNSSSSVDWTNSVLVLGLPLSQTLAL